MRCEMRSLSRSKASAVLRYSSVGVLEGRTRFYHRSSAEGSSSNSSQIEKGVSFDSPEAVTRGKSTWEVFRGWLVFKLFSYDWLVDNNLKVHGTTRGLLTMKI